MANKSKYYYLTTCALMAALMCVLGPMSVSIGPIPVSLTNLVIYLTVWLLGAKTATVSVAVYLLLGAVGLPVFSNFSGGLGKLLGPTGGYLIGFLAVAYIGGLVVTKTRGNVFATFAALVVGTAVLYTFGTVWFLVLTKAELGYALSVCVTPFIGLDLAKMALATVVGKPIRMALEKSKLLPA